MLNLGPYTILSREEISDSSLINLVSTLEGSISSIIHSKTYWKYTLEKKEILVKDLEILKETGLTLLLNKQQHDSLKKFCNLEKYPVIIITKHL